MAFSKWTEFLTHVHVMYYPRCPAEPLPLEYDIINLCEALRTAHDPFTRSILVPDRYTMYTTCRILSPL
jgi:hypothetical protein